MKSTRVVKCKCGKTKDPNGNCDGSHAKPQSKLTRLSLALMFLLGGFVLQSFAPSDNINVKSSTIEWKGEKVVGSHEGTISLKSAGLIYEGKKLTGGSFVIDMTSITCTDLTGEYKSNLEGHLKSDDFFSISNYPTANLVITKVSKPTKDNYNISAKLTIKGITQNIDFVAKVNGKTLSTTLAIDRTKFNIKYGSGSFFDSLGDNMIYDDFELKVKLEI